MNLIPVLPTAVGVSSITVLRLQFMLLRPVVQAAAAEDWSPLASNSLACGSVEVKTVPLAASSSSGSSSDEKFRFLHTFAR